MESEKFAADPRKVLLIKDYLDRGFKRGSVHTLGEDGFPAEINIVAMLGTDGSVLRNMTAEQMFYLLQDRFKNILSDGKKRDRFIKKVLVDWYNKDISKEGLLKSNLI